MFLVPKNLFTTPEHFRSIIVVVFSGHYPLLGVPGLCFWGMTRIYSFKGDSKMIGSEVVGHPVAAHAASSQVRQHVFWWP